jgi:hypothetical protein
MREQAMAAAKRLAAGEIAVNGSLNGSSVKV